MALLLPPHSPPFPTPHLSPSSFSFAIAGLYGPILPTRDIPAALLSTMPPSLQAHAHEIIPFDLVELGEAYMRAIPRQRQVRVADRARKILRSVHQHLKKMSEPERMRDGRGEA
ncbi:hypothetical protein BGX38DRAFT_1146962 [Terfezia claveryi]|nr:hypothetical protein BGX38DRAFT_1146962 [Terfezia claveryi]